MTHDLCLWAVNICVGVTHLSQVGKSSPCQHYCGSETRTGCCWEPDPPEGVSVRWSAPDTSPAALQTSPATRRFDPTECSTHPPIPQQSPAEPQSAHSHPTTTERERDTGFRFLKKPLMLFWKKGCVRYVFASMLKTVL